MVDDDLALYPTKTLAERAPHHRPAPDHDRPRAGTASRATTYSLPKGFTPASGPTTPVDNPPNPTPKTKNIAPCADTEHPRKRSQAYT